MAGINSIYNSPINHPSGSGGGTDDFRLIRHVVTEQEVVQIAFDTDENGLPFSLTEIIVFGKVRTVANPTVSTGIQINFNTDRAWNGVATILSVPNAVDNMSTCFARFQIIDGIITPVQMMSGQNFTSVIENLLNHNASNNVVYRLNGRIATMLDSTEIPVYRMDSINKIAIGSYVPVLGINSVFDIYGR